MEIKFFIQDKATLSKSKPITIMWFLFGEDDLEFDDGTTLPLKDFKFFINDFIIEIWK